MYKILSSLKELYSRAQYLEKKTDLKNIKITVTEFEKRLSAKIGRQEKINNRNFKKKSYQENIWQKYCIDKTIGSLR